MTFQLCQLLEWTNDGICMGLWILSCLLFMCCRLHGLCSVHQPSGPAVESTGQWRWSALLHKNLHRPSEEGEGELAAPLFAALLALIFIFSSARGQKSKRFWETELQIIFVGITVETLHIRGISREYVTSVSLLWIWEASGCLCLSQWLSQKSCPT